MAEVPTRDNVTRRSALKIIVGSASAAVSLPALGGTGPRPSAPACLGAPQASTAVASPARAAKFFNEGQARTIDALAETIIPADGHSPGAKSARVWEYIDEIVADSDDSTKRLWMEGVAAVDRIAEQAHQQMFADCSPDQQIALLEQIARNEEHPTTLEERFFVAAKRATVDGYYTSTIGIHQDLEYQGNTALMDFPGCSHEDHKK